MVATFCYSAPEDCSLFELFEATLIKHGGEVIRFAVMMEAAGGTPGAFFMSGPPGQGSRGEVGSARYQCATSPAFFSRA